MNKSCTDAYNDFFFFVSMLMDHWIIWYGIPGFLLMDNRTQFISKLPESLCAFLGAKHLTRMAYHPTKMGKLKDLIRRLLHG